MPDQQSEHEKPQDMVESSQELEREAARSLEDAADSHGTLQGFFAVNDERPPEDAGSDQDRDKPPSENREKGHRVP
jgi:hypothetical protein